MSTESPKTEAPAADDVRDRILRAAFSAFVERGYSAVSMLAIATRARVSKRDLYARFANKQAVLIGCIQRRAGRMQARPDLPAPRDHAELASSLTTLASTIVAEASDPVVIAMFQFAIAEIKRAPEVAAAVQARGREAPRRAVADLLSEAQTAGLIAEGQPLELADQYLGLLWEGLLVALILGVADTPSPEQISQRAAKATAALLALHATPA